MSFEDAIASLGAELGFDLPVEEGVARLEAAGGEADEDVIDVALSEMPDMGGALLSSEVGELSEVTALQPLLEANYIFAETAGATLSLEDGRIYFEQYVPISAIGRGEGTLVVKLFVAHVREWRRRLSGADGADAGDAEAIPGRAATGLTQGWFAG